MTALATFGSRAFRVAAVRRAALAAGAVRGHRLVLIFHRIGDDEGARPGIVPCVPESLFRRQLDALLDAGEIVPLEDLWQPGSDWYRPRFALTFDDDWTTHYERVLPVLLNRGVPATFFLSGRSLHGLGALWFEKLDALVAVRGFRAAARFLGIDVADPGHLAMACENDRRLQERIARLPDGESQRLNRAEIRALAEAGMTIGFHTLQHPLLPMLGDAALDEALVRGRKELEDAAGRPMRLFAYPHGKADARLAERLPRAGFVAAFTGRPGPVRPGDDPYLLGRWEAGPIGVDRFVAGTVARLNGWRSGA